MRRLKRIVIITTFTLTPIVVGVVILAGLLGASGRGDYVVYQSIDEMASTATDIVRVVALGQRLSIRTTLLPPPSGPDNRTLADRIRNSELQTIRRFRVLEVFKGDTQTGDIIEVAQSVRFMSRPRSNRISFSRGDDLILFMRTFYASHGCSGPGILLSAYQSVFRVTPSNAGTASEFADGIIAAYYENPLVGSVALENFAPYIPNFSWTLTVSQLMWIRYESGLGTMPGPRATDDNNAYSQNQ